MRQDELYRGQRLRELRRQRGKTQLDIELEADLGSGYLQRVESGKVKQPQRTTLERILQALEVDSRETAEVLALFEYTSSLDLPTSKELEWARSCCQDDMQEVSLPAYLLDCAHRLLAWNTLIPSLLGIAPDDAKLSQLMGHSIIDAWFDPRSCFGALIHDPEHFYPPMIHALYHEMRPFRHEAWYADLTTHWLQELPLLRRYWHAAPQQETSSAVANRLLHPLLLKGPQGQLLQFRLATEHFTQDRRFRILYYIPADSDTMRFCEKRKNDIQRIL